MVYELVQNYSKLSGTDTITHGPLTIPLVDSSKFWKRTKSVKEDVRLDGLRYSLDQPRRPKKFPFPTLFRRCRETPINPSEINILLDKVSEKSIKRSFVV
ncbi:hypothetical protein DPMN_037855 [Dreissena polymorpha]|uniref:Uncharacterized protein n=1 Tax=Dreissena polymorpha TaxID=45954 RepID=A0A9D4RQ76_DREPO|nr:hypothetical protein DPMN_037855 [Dreissena polymorpha]